MMCDWHAAVLQRLSGEADGDSQFEFDLATESIKMPTIPQEGVEAKTEHEMRASVKPAPKKRGRPPKAESAKTAAAKSDDKVTPIGKPKKDSAQETLRKKALTDAEAIRKAQEHLGSTEDDADSPQPQATGTDGAPAWPE